MTLPIDLIFWCALALAAALSMQQPRTWRTFAIGLLLLALALTGEPAHAAACNWNAPGAAPFAGRLDLAVENYRDLPAPVRKQLAAKINAHQYDDVVEITRDGIQGEASYIGLRDMHWSRGLCAGPVNRKAWAEGATERGLVYCVGGHCLMVPSVCRNLSVVTRIPPARQSHTPATGTSDAPTAGSGLAAQPAPSSGLDLPGNLAAPSAVPGQEVAENPGAGLATLALGPLIIGSGAAPLAPVQVPTVTPAVPEVSTWALMALGLAALLVLGLKR